MRVNCPSIVLGTVALVITTAALAAPTTAPTTQSSRPRTVRLPAPYNLLADLTDDQKGKINQIHEDYLDQWASLKKSADQKCGAVLTDQQKKELEDAVAKAIAARKKPKK